MDRAYPSTRRIEERLHFRRRAFAAMSAGIAACAVAWTMLPTPAPHASWTADTGTTAIPATVPVSDPMPAARRVYRYSVVPGGALDRAELERVLRDDKVVAAHYAGFDASRAHVVAVSVPRAVYVSYRKGDKIYWTSKKLMLEVGETLLTDGRNEMRARCANRISDVPRFPVEANPPSPGSLDEPVEDGTAGEIGYVGMPEEELVELSGEPFKLVWPAAPGVPDNPRPGRTPIAVEPASGLPPLSGSTPGLRLLASGTAPPLSNGVTVVPVADMPPPAIVDIEPFVPQPDPSHPAQPSNPPLDGQQPADVPEPSSAWLFAGALLALVLRRKRP